MLKIMLTGALVALSAASSTVMGCSVQIEHYIWDLNSLRVPSKTGDYSVSFTNGNGAQDLTFNLCKNTNTKCTPGDKEVHDFAHLHSNSTCQEITTSEMDDAEAYYLDKNNVDAGLSLVWETS